MFSRMINRFARLAHRVGSRSTSSVRSRPSRREAFSAGIEGLEGRAIPSAFMLQATDVPQGGTVTITPPGSWEPPPEPTDPSLTDDGFSLPVPTLRGPYSSLWD